MVTQDNRPLAAPQPTALTPEAAHIPPANTGHALMQDIELTDDAVRLPARVYRPDRPGPRPVVVLAPGGLQQGNLLGHDWIGTRLAAAGYLALGITYRAANPLDDPLDVALALAWLEREPGADRDRLATFGGSRGGVTALRVAAGDPRVRAVIALAPPADLTRYTRSVAAFAPARYAEQVEWMGGTPDEVPERYAAVRALDYADRIHQPVLLIHGTLDMVAPWDHSIWMEQALRAAGNARVRLELIPLMGHFLEMTTQGYQFDRVAGVIIDWLAPILNQP